MKQISKPDNLAKALNFKISNMNMNVIIKFSKLKGVISNSSWIDSARLDDYTLPTFTKKIFNHLKKDLMKNIAIIGAGISGLYIANLLSQNSNYQVTIYEKNSFC